MHFSRHSIIEVLPHLAKFAGLGLLLGLSIKLLASPAEFLSRLPQNAVFLAVFSLAMGLLDVYIYPHLERKVWRYALTYILAGLSGLVFIEWLFNGNLAAGNFISQLVFFSFWSLVGFFPALYIHESERNGFWLDILTWIGFPWGVILSLAGLFFFIFDAEGGMSGDIWRFSVFFSILVANPALWREIWLARREMVKPKLVDEVDASSEALVADISWTDEE